MEVFEVMVAPLGDKFDRDTVAAVDGVVKGMRYGSSVNAARGCSRPCGVRTLRLRGSAALVPALRPIGGRPQGPRWGEAVCALRGSALRPLAATDPLRGSACLGRPVCVFRASHRGTALSPGGTRNLACRVYQRLSRGVRSGAGAQGEALGYPGGHPPPAWTSTREQARPPDPARARAL